MLDPIKDIIRLSGLPDPVLHLLLGLAIYLISAAVLKRPLWSWTPWLIAFAFQAINEMADVGRDLMEGDIIRWRGGLIDTVVTMALPTLILLISKVRRRRQTRVPQ